MVQYLIMNMNKQKKLLIRKEKNKIWNILTTSNKGFHDNLLTKLKFMMDKCGFAWEKKIEFFITQTGYI